jgi:hypothetical protein
MPSLNIFDSDGFTLFELSQVVILSQPYRPGKLGAMRNPDGTTLFREYGITTTSIGFERIGATLMLVPVSPRGGPPPTQPRDRRSLIDVKAPRVALQDAVLADEVQNLRALGSQTEVETVQGLLLRRSTTGQAHINQTLEWQKLGALKGQVLDADGTSVLIDYFSLHGVTRQTEIDFDLDNGNPVAGALMARSNQVIRQIEDELGGLMYTGVHAFAGKVFMDQLTQHPQYLATFQATNAAALRNRTVGVTAEYGGITYEEYRGSIAGVQFVPDNKAIFFPLGVPDMFQVAYAPADYEEAVNTEGLPIYLKQWPDGGANRSRHFEVQSNPITFNSRPRAVQFGRNT